MRPLNFLFTFILLIFLGSLSCSKDSRNPSDNGNMEEPPIAVAGNDQTIEAGSFAFVDVSASKPSDRSKIKAFVWIPADNNPSKPIFFPDSTETKYHIEFVETGTYNFLLYVVTESGYSAPDTLTITVKPRTSLLIKDIYLELAIRRSDNFYSGPIDENYLAQADSISYYKKSVISTITGLEYCKNLKYLDLSNQDLYEISSLSTLTGIEHLNLFNNPRVEYLSPLTNLTSMKYLNLESCEMTDVKYIENMKSLSYLNLISRKDLTDIPPIKDFTKLEVLKISSAPIKNISFIINMPNIKVLWLRGTDIKDLSPLENLSGLQELNMDLNFSLNTTSIKKLTTLKVLSLEMCSRDRTHPLDISPITYLKNLTSLSLRNNQITNIQPLVLNEGLGVGDYINLKTNKLDSLSVNVYMYQLFDRGVYVDY